MAFKCRKCGEEKEDSQKGIVKGMCKDCSLSFKVMGIFWLMFISTIILGLGFYLKDTLFK